MSRRVVDRVADAVLYEGYILYPYRPSVKNRQRWTFGGLFPEAYCLAHGGEAAANRTECLIAGGPDATLGVIVRFLHLTDRIVGEYVPPLERWPGGDGLPYRPVELLRISDQLYQAWQEAEERAVELTGLELGEIAAHLRTLPFAFPGGWRLEPLHGPAGEVVGVLARTQQPVEGLVEVAATPVEEGLFRVRVSVRNRTPMENAGDMGRDDGLLRALVSAHTILTVRGGEFVSLLDPPPKWRGSAEACRNEGVWPVLVGEEGERDTVLASPIILYDYPQLAPESPGDLFDATEIDEILTLRILTMTDEEKRQAAAVDDRARDLLARTEALAREQLAALHGTVRGMRPLPTEDAHD
jgi:hydrogenase maturation protease